MIGPVDDSSLTELESRHKMRILFLLTLLFSFSCCLRLSPPWNPPLDPPEVPIRYVWAVKDGKAELPCDIVPPDPTDQIYLVLWYREPAGKPLYSFDLRGKHRMLESTGLPSQLLGLDNEQILEFQLQKATLLLLSRRTLVYTDAGWITGILQQE